MIRSLAPLVAAALLASACTSPALAESVVAAPAAKVVANEGKGLKTAIFAGGCFWGIEGVFSHVKGVTSAVSGYHGGTAATATYAQTSPLWPPPMITASSAMCNPTPACDE